MAPTLRLLLVTFSLVDAARLWENSETENALLESAGSTGNGEIICGDYQIWSKLTASSSPTSIRNIKWGKIMSIADDFIHERTVKKDKLETELAHLRSRIAEKKKSELPDLTTREELETLIQESLASFKGPERASATNSEAAKETHCGKPFTKPRAPKGAYPASKKAFQQAADQFFDESKRLDRDLFQEVCHELLPPESPETSYCGPLCQFFHDTAKDFSNERAGETGGLLSDDLIKTLMAQQLKLTSVTGDITRCEKAKERIASFQSEVEVLKKTGDECVQELQDAEWALDDAQFGLEELSEKLDEQQLALAEAEKTLVGDDAKLVAAKKDIKDTAENGNALRAQISTIRTTLGKLTEDLQAAEEATGVSFNLKMALEAVMKAMLEFFDEAALEPLRFMGLDEECKVGDYFDSPEKNEAEKKAVQVLGAGVDSLSSYCQTTAKTAFEAVKDSVDLWPMCEFGVPETVKSETLAAVKAVEKKFVDEVNDILNWLNPYRNGMTQEVAQERVNSGEVRGFQEVIAVYARTDFFRGYLRKWRKGGEIVQLLAGLSKIVAQLKEDRQKAEQEISNLEKELEKVGPRLDQLLQDLQAAEAAKALSTDAQKQLSNSVQTLTAEASTMNDLITQLLERVRKAKLACQKVDQDLEATLEKLRSNWGKGGGEFLEISREQRKLAGQRLERMRHLVASSERALRAAQAAAATEE